MPVYELEIVNTRLRSYRLLTLFIVLIQVCYFVFSLFDPAKRNNAVINLSFILVFVLYRLWISKKQKTTFYFNEWIFFLLMTLWVNEILISIINGIFFILYTVSIQKIIYSFSNENIKLNKLPFTTYEWHALENIVLKDGILTLDFKNNKLAQLNVFKTDINEIEFNRFAQQQLDKA